MIDQLNSQLKSVQAKRHHGSGLWFIHSADNEKSVLNSAMSYEWVIRSLKDWIDYEARYNVTGSIKF